MSDQIPVPGTVPPPTPLLLQNVSVDYSSIQQEFEADLRVQRSWSTLLPTATGSALVRWLASVLNALMGAVARALQEGYPDTARTPGGVLRAQRLFQGGGIIRRRPGSLIATTYRTDQLTTSLVIPADTQWNVGGQGFYNRDPVVIPGDGQVQATLYAGLVQRAVVQSDGSVFQRFVIGEPNQWDVGNDDFYAVDALNNKWTTVANLWEGNDDPVFRASTLTDGTVECSFGDGYYGAVPPVGPLTFVYASVDSAANTRTGPLVGTQVSVDVPGISTFAVTGTTITTTAPNQDQPPPEFYKAVGPGLASSYERAVSRPDYRDRALRYDGVVDAVFQAQAENNPADVRWMNIVTATLITTRPWTSNDWLAFKTYMENDVAISNVWLVRRDPVQVVLPIEMEIGANDIADTTSLELLAKKVITAYFVPRAGSLGDTTYPDDLSSLVRKNAIYQQAPNEAGSLVDWIRVLHPLEPVVLPPLSYFVLDPARLSVRATKTRRGPVGRLGNFLGLT